MPKHLEINNYTSTAPRTRHPPASSPITQLASTSSKTVINTVFIRILTYFQVIQDNIMLTVLVAIVSTTPLATSSTNGAHFFFGTVRPSNSHLRTSLVIYVQHTIYYISLTIPNHPGAILKTFIQVPPRMCRHRSFHSL